MGFGREYKKKFFIKEKSTRPPIEYPLYDSILNTFSISENMLKSVGVTFSMYDVETKAYIVANSPARLVISKDRAAEHHKTKYTLQYDFKEYETSDSGYYIGEFVVDFIGYDACGKVKFPKNNGIDIIVTPSITKTTVI